MKNVSEYRKKARASLEGQWGSMLGSFSFQSLLG